MTQAPEPPFQSPTGPPPAPAAGHPRLYQVAAWVVIVAGIVFVVAVVFFTGAWAGGGGHHFHHHHHGVFGPDGPGGPDGPPPWPGPWGQGPGPGGPGWPGPWGPGWVPEVRVARAVTAIAVAPRSRPRHRRAHKPGYDLAGRWQLA